MIKSSGIIVAGATLAVILFAFVAAATETDGEKAAVAAAEKWLVLVDNRKYTDSWQEAAETFRVRIDQKSWELRLRSDREPEGRCITRKFISSAFRNPPGADGGRKRIVLRFSTSFQNRKYAVERLTLVSEKDGTWRVNGYLITSAVPGLRSIIISLLLFIVIILLWRMELKGQKASSEG